MVVLMKTCDDAPSPPAAQNTDVLLTSGTLGWGEGREEIGEQREPVKVKSVSRSVVSDSL